VKELSKVFAFGPVIDRTFVLGSSITGYAASSVSALLKRHPLDWITNTVRPKGLVHIPKNLHVGNPEIAKKMYGGCYPFAGIAPELGGRSPFDITPPSKAWEAELLGFSWLNDLAATDGKIIKALARALTQDWIETQGTGHAVAWRPDIISKRLLNWLSNADLLLSDTSQAARVNILRSIGRQLHELEASIHKSPDGPHRLAAACTLIIASLSLKGLESLHKRSLKVLDFELNRQILADGGHLSRSPQALVDTIAILLPTKLCFIHKGLPIPQALITAIDRIFPMVRFFLHGDGGLAGFNGVSGLKVADVKILFEHDETKGRPFTYAPHSGYHRLEAKRTTIFVDTGTAPPTTLSHRAHASCLAMELSDGPHRIIVNCGAMSDERSPLFQAARATAAHSALTINDRSSLRMISPGRLARFIGTPVIGKRINVGSRRTRCDDGILLESGHDGYVERYGLRHERRIFLNHTGNEVRGEDRINRIQRRRNPLIKNTCDTFTMRFHLHPDIQPTPTRDGRQIFLILPDKTGWVFSLLSGKISIDESIYLLDRPMPAKTRQLVICGEVHDQVTVKWSFKKVSAERISKEDAMAKIEQETPLPLGDI